METTERDNSDDVDEALLKDIHEFVHEVRSLLRPHSEAYFSAYKLLAEKGARLLADGCPQQAAHAFYFSGMVQSLSVLHSTTFEHIHNPKAWGFKGIEDVLENVVSDVMSELMQRFTEGPSPDGRPPNEGGKESEWQA